MDNMNKSKQELETGFAEWCSKNGWKYCFNMPNPKWLNNWDHDKTTSELYQMYLKWLESNGK